MFEKKRIYLDNTATTRTRREVISEMHKYFSSVYANPSSIHQDGLIARGSIEMARERIALAIGCSSEELIFTGSGSESNNLAIRGIAQALSEKGRHIITSKAEHSSVINTCQALEQEGFEITYIDVDRQGCFDIDQLAGSIKSGTVLVSLCYVNNEVGTVQDIEKAISIVKGRDVLLHVDAVQALPYFKLNLARINADLVSFSGHKLYVPKGIGILYKKSGTPLTPVINGGEQEFGMRSGTENVPYAVGLSKAIMLNQKEKEVYVQRMTALRDSVIKGVLSSVPDCMLTGDPVNRAPNHASFCFKGVNGKMLVKQLSLHGFDVSSGSACSSPNNAPSHVLVACKIPEDYLYGSLRVTVGRYNTEKDVARFVDVLPKVMEKMRNAGVSYNNEQIFISQEEFQRKLALGEELQIIDVRPLKYPLKMIPGSVYIPNWRLKAQITKFNPGVETIVICYQGDIISPEVQQLLMKHGFTKVKVLKGGFFSYSGGFV